MTDILAIIANIGHSLIGLAGRYIFKIVLIAVNIGIAAVLLDRLIDEIKDRRDKENWNKHNQQ